jgi:hypothetical protein
MVFFPHDEVWVRYLVTGATVDRRGQLNAEITVEVTNPEGQVVDRQVKTTDGELPFGGDSFLDCVHLTLPDQYDPGEYTLRVTVKDRFSSEVASFQRTLSFQTGELVLVPPQFFYDSEGHLPAPYGGLVGQILHFRLKASGFERAQGTMNPELNIRVLDAAGQVLLSRPITVSKPLENRDLVKQVSHLDFSGSLVLHRAGDFLLVFTLTERVTKKTATFKATLHITAP